MRAYKGEDDVFEVGEQFTMPDDFEADSCSGDGCYRKLPPGVVMTVVSIHDDGTLHKAEGSLVPKLPPANSKTISVDASSLDGPGVDALLRSSGFAIKHIGGE